MDNHRQIMAEGERLYQIYSRTKHFPWSTMPLAPEGSPMEPAYILVEDRFTSGHDDSATFVELINEKEEILVSCRLEGVSRKYFDNPPFYDVDCLVYYLRETWRIPVKQCAWSGPKGQL